MEEWRNIPGFEGLYQVSNMGRVKSLSRKKGRILKPVVHSNGYMRINLYAGKKPQRKYVHRLVAETFLVNPQNKREVNHLDGDKTNNSIFNLEWATPRENGKHSSKTGLTLRAEKHKEWKGYIDIFTPDGTFVVQTDSLIEAANWICRNTEYNKKAAWSNIDLVVLGKRATAYGFIFRRTREKK
jgi:hypothetical protein